MKKKEIGFLVIRPLTVIKGPHFETYRLALHVPSISLPLITQDSTPNELQHEWTQAYSTRITKEDTQLKISAVGVLKDAETHLEGICPLADLHRLRFMELKVELAEHGFPLAELCLQLEIYFDNDSLNDASIEEDHSQIEAEDQKKDENNLLHRTVKKKMVLTEEMYASAERDKVPQFLLKPASHRRNSTSVGSQGRMRSSIFNSTLQRHILKTDLKFTV